MAYLKTLATGENTYDVFNPDDLPETYPPSPHNHDDRYYTESEMDTKLAEKANTEDLGTMAAENDAASDGKTYGRKDGEWSEVVTDVNWGDIGGTLSDQADLQEALDNKAPDITKSVSGSIVTIHDAADGVNLEDLKVDISATQDLYGYDNPWPAGGGANLLPTITPGTYTASGVTATVSENGLIKVTGQKNVSTNVDIQLPIAKAYGANTSHYIHLRNSFVYTGLLFSIGGIGASLASINRIFKFSNDVNPMETCYLRIPSGLTDELDFTLQPSIELTGNTTSWTPYANICPITGHSSAVVTRTGKNLLNPANFVSNYVSVTDGVYTFNKTGYNANLYSGQSGSTYTVDMTNANKFPFLQPGSYVLSYKLTSGSPLSRIWLTNPDGSWKSITPTIVITDDLYVCKFAITKPTMITIIRASNVTTVFSEPQLELGSEFTGYEPYQGASLTIPLGQTVYSGTLDVLMGTMTIKSVSVTLGELPISRGTSIFNVASGDYFGSLATTKAKYKGVVLSECYQNLLVSPSNPVDNRIYVANSANAPILRISDSRYTDAETYISAMGSSRIVFELATPLTYTLTPVQLSTLLGQNNILADTGDILDLKYRADTKLYIDQKIEEKTNAVKKIMTTTTNTMVAPKNLTFGEIIIVNDDLYKATSNIANGATLTVGTNVTKVTLAEWVASLLS